jgi:hypothetical protein
MKPLHAGMYEDESQSEETTFDLNMKRRQDKKKEGMG